MIHVTKKRNRRGVMQRVVVFLFAVVFGTDFGFAQECTAGANRPEVFAESIVEHFEENEWDRVFFDTDHLVSIAKMHDTACCKKDAIALVESDCDEKRMIDPSLGVVPSSIQLQAHILNLIRLVVQGDTGVCKARDISCDPYLYKQEGKPSPFVCWRNGSNEEEGGDSRCESEHAVTTGTNALLSSTEITTPSTHQGLFQKFILDTGRIVPPPKKGVKTTDDFSVSSLLYTICHEYEMIVDHERKKQGLGDISDAFTSCLEEVKMILHGRIGSFSRVANLDSGLTTIQRAGEKMNDDAYETANKLSDKIYKMIVTATNVLKKMGNTYTQVCDLSGTPH